MPKEQLNQPNSPRTNASVLLRKLIEESIASGNPIPVNKDYWTTKRSLLLPTGDQQQ